MSANFFHLRYCLSGFDGLQIVFLFLLVCVALWILSVESQVPVQVRAFLVDHEAFLAAHKSVTSQFRLLFGLCLSDEPHTFWKVRTEILLKHNPYESQTLQIRSVCSFRGPSQSVVVSFPPCLAYYLPSFQEKDVQDLRRRGYRNGGTQIIHLEFYPETIRKTPDEHKKCDAFPFLGKFRILHSRTDLFGVSTTSSHPFLKRVLETVLQVVVLGGSFRRLSPIPSDGMAFRTGARNEHQPGQPNVAALITGAFERCNLFCHGNIMAIPNI